MRRLPATIFQDNSEIGGLDGRLPLTLPSNSLGEPRNISEDPFVHLSILHSESGKHGPELGTLVGVEKRIPRRSPSAN